MFSVGLEFSLPQLIAMRRMVFGFGGAQVVAIMALGMRAARSRSGAAGARASCWAASLAMSSTAIVSKMLAERTQLHPPHGRQIMGVLLFQDLAVIPLLVLMPALALAGEAIAVRDRGGARSRPPWCSRSCSSLGQRLMRPLFHLVARQKSSELFVLFVLLVTLGLAWVTELAGLSLALGAFLAGMLISETEYRYQVEDYIKPFRDVLLGLFFVTIGMLLDVRALADATCAAVVVLFVALLVVKFVRDLRARRAPSATRKPTALRAALALAPAGEFGFVLLALAARHQALDEATLQVVLAATLLSMLVGAARARAHGAHRAATSSRANGRSAPWRCTTSR